MVNDIEGLVSAFGGPGKLGKVLGCTSQNISLWSIRGGIPPSWHMRIFLLCQHRGIEIDPHKLFDIPRDYARKALSRAA